MRLLFVSQLFPPFALGGYEYNCRDIADVMRDMGHEVSVITSTYGVEGPVREPNVWRIFKLRHDYGTEKDPHKAAVGQSRVQVDLHNVRALRAELRRTMPDAIIVWAASNLGPLPAWVAESFAPTVYELGDEWLAPLLHGPNGGTLRRRVRRIYRGLLGIPDRPLQGTLVFVSRALAESYRKQGARMESFRINYVGIDPELFQAQPQASRRTSAMRRILFTGRIEPRKGTTTLVRAFGRLQRKVGMTETRLTLVGPSTPDYISELWALADKEGVHDKLTIQGPAARAQLPKLYSEHDVLAFPSEWLEPFAMTPIEAMACAIPVVSSLAGGSTELVRDHENAVAFSAGDVDDLADKLAWVLSHREEAAAMALRASEEVRSKYTLRRQAEGLLDAVAEANAKPKVAA